MLAHIYIYNTVMNCGICAQVMKNAKALGESLQSCPFALQRISAVCTYIVLEWKIMEVRRPDAPNRAFKFGSLCGSIVTIVSSTKGFDVIYSELC